MEILRNFLGNLGSGVVRLLVTVAILAAVGIFIVRPVLDSTEKVAHETNQAFEKSFHGFGDNGAGLEDINKTLKEVNKQVQQQIRHSFHAAKVHSVGQPKKLLKCIERADGNVHRITRCTAKF